MHQPPPTGAGEMIHPPHPFVPSQQSAAHKTHIHMHEPPSHQSAAHNTHMHMHEPHRQSAARTYTHAYA